MSIVGRRLLFSGPSAKATRAGTEWKQVWQYQTNDPLDGPQVILDHLAANGPWFGAAYSNGNDYDRWSLVEEIEIPQHATGAAEFWQVNISYKPASGGGGLDPKPRQGDDGEYYEEPWMWSAEVSTSVQQVSVPVDEARYITGFTHVPPRVEEDKLIPFTNSTLVEKHDPPLERDDAHMIIKIKSWHLKIDFDFVQIFLNTVNNRKMVFNSPDYEGTFPAYTIRFVNFEMTERREILTFGGIRRFMKFYETVAELHYNPHGWRIDVVDRGTMRGALPHEPNGRGGIVTYVTPLGGVAAAKIVDFDGLPVGTPVLLDGGGQPQDWSVLGVGATRPPTVAPVPVKISWKIYRETDLSIFAPIKRGMFSL